MASVTHQVAIHRAAATTKIPFESKDSDCKNSNVKIKNIGPRNNPMS